MQKTHPEIIDFDLSETSAFGSHSNDPVFVFLVIAILAVLSFCVCRMLIKPKEALCYESLKEH